MWYIRSDLNYFAGLEEILDLQTGISLGPLRWLEDTEEIRTDEYDRFDASVDQVI
jgi:hypothetical protein